MNVERMVTALILLILGIVIIFNILGSTSSTITDAADNVSGSGLPLASLFGSSGVLLLMFMAGILLAIAFAIFKFARGGK